MLQFVLQSDLFISADDSRLFALQVGGEVTDVRDILVQNFFEELRQVVPE